MRVQRLSVANLCRWAMSHDRKHPFSWLLTIALQRYARRRLRSGGVRGRGSPRVAHGPAATRHPGEHQDALIIARPAGMGRLHALPIGVVPAGGPPLPMRSPPHRPAVRTAPRTPSGPRHTRSTGMRTHGTQGRKRCRPRIGSSHALFSALSGDAASGDSAAAWT